MIPIENNPEKIRNEIFKMLMGNEIPKSEAEQILSQCLAFVKDNTKIQKMADELGLKLSGFTDNKALELYYDIEKEGRNIGYISKGWNEQGFRIGELITCKQKDMDVLRNNFDKILNTCATQGTALGAKIVNGDLQLDLNINIYQDGLTTNVLKNALETLEFTINKLKSLINQ